METLYYGVTAVIAILLAVLVSVVVAMEWFKKTEFVEKQEDKIISLILILVNIITVLFVSLLFYSGVVLLISIFTGIV